MSSNNKLLAVALSAALCICLSACAPQVAQPTQTADTAPTARPTEATVPVTTDPAPSQAPTETTAPTQSPSVVPVDFHGLHFDLDDRFTLTETENDLSFQSDAVTGGVTFGNVSKLTGGFAHTSSDYAIYLQRELQEEYEKIWVGSSTGVGYYLVLQSSDSTRVQCLYVKGEEGWNIWAESTDETMTDELIRICGKCAILPSDT